jgi:hypothetical protein
MNHVTGARFVTGDITTDTLLHAATGNFSETKKKNTEKIQRVEQHESGDEEDFLETPCKLNKISFEEFLSTYFFEELSYRTTNKPTGNYTLMFEKIIFKTIHNGMLVLSQNHMRERKKDCILKIYNLIKF